MQQEIKQRNSSIELLRIVSMLLIVIYHYEARDFNLYVVGSDRALEDGILPQLLMHSFGKLGVPVFVFISGWYGIKFKWNRFWEMIAMCAFYVLLSVIGSALLYHDYAIKKIFFFLNMWWFMSAYLCVYILSPAIEFFFKTCSKWHTFTAVALFVYVSFGDLFVDYAQIGGLFEMMSMYLAARWMRLYMSEWLNKWWCPLLVTMLIIRFGMITGGCITGHLGLLPYLNSYVNPFTSLTAATIFLTFKNMKFHSKVVNRMAASSLAVYLCSESSFGQVFFDQFFPHEVWNMPHFIYGGVVVYVIVSIIEQIRKPITNYIIKFIK